MKTAISIPDETFRRAEDGATRLGISRSEFFRRAAERWLADLDAGALTAEIDAVVGDGGDRENEEFLRVAAQGTLQGSPE